MDPRYAANKHKATVKQFFYKTKPFWSLPHIAAVQTPQPAPLRFTFRPSAPAPSASAPSMPATPTTVVPANTPLDSLPLEELMRMVRQLPIARALMSTSAGAPTSASARASVPTRQPTSSPPGTASVQAPARYVFRFRRPHSQDSDSNKPAHTTYNGGSGGYFTKSSNNTSGKVHAAYDGGGGTFSPRTYASN